jgi:hypothetical protein
MINIIDAAMLSAIGNANIREMATTPYLPLTEKQLDEIDQALSGIVA